MSEDTRVTIELNPREQRLYDRLRARVVAPGPGGSGPGDLLLLLPDLAILLLRLLRDDRVPRGSKLVAILGVGYVISPIDVLPAILLGPVGLLDDLFVVGTALSRLLNRVHPDVVRSHWSGQGDVLDVIQRSTRWAEQQLGMRVKGLLGSIPGFERR